MSNSTALSKPQMSRKINFILIDHTVSIVINLYLKLLKSLKLRQDSQIKSAFDIYS